MPGPKRCQYTVVLDFNSRETVLSEPSINVRVDLGDLPRWMNRDDRDLLVVQFRKGRHFASLLKALRSCTESPSCSD